MVLVAFLVLVILGFLGAIVFFFPPGKEYVVLREVPVTTYYLRTVTTTATLRTVATSSSFMSTVTRESVVLRIVTTGVINGTLGLLSYTTETMTLWTRFNQTIVSTTTITSIATSASTYTRTIWTTVTVPPGAVVISPIAPNQAKGFAELVLCSAFVAGTLVIRRRSIFSHN